MMCNNWRSLILLTLITASVGCGTFSRHEKSGPQSSEKSPTTTVATPAQSTPTTSSTTDHHSPSTASAHHEVAQGTEPEVALRWLKNGNIRFVKHHLRKDGQSLKDVQRLAAGQKPHTIVISCSDSRVPPEILFDQKLGEIFVVRTAGETLDPTSLASVEYALEHLGTKSVLVLGHTQCGAVKAACQTLNGADAGSDNLNKLVADIHPRIAEFKNKANSKGFVDESWANVIGVSRDLTKRSKIIAEKSAAHQIKISTAVYDIETGVVNFR